jgi:hypothetical protein
MGHTVSFFLIRKHRIASERSWSGIPFLRVEATPFQSTSQTILSLENSGFRGDEPQTVRALWKVYGCPAARNLHLTGEKTRELISILASGGAASPVAEKTFPIPHSADVVVLRNLQVLRASTYKYDADVWIYKLNLYSATAKIGNSENPIKIGEGTALWKYFTGLGLKTDLGMEGAHFEIATVDCQIDAKFDIRVPTRFQWDLAVPEWALPDGRVRK